MKQKSFWLSAVAVLLLFMGWQWRYADHEDAKEVQPLYGNVYRDDFANEWAHLRDEFQLPDKALMLNDVSMDYLPNGDVRQIHWSFAVEDPKRGWMDFEVNRYEGSPTYSVRYFGFQPEAGRVNGALGVHEMSQALTPAFFQAITPDEQPSYFHMTFRTSMYVQPFEKLPSNTQIVQNNALGATIDSGEGYFLHLFSMYQQSDGQFSGSNPKSYLWKFPE